MGKSIQTKTKIGIIGAGKVGTSLALSFDKRKNNVYFYSYHYNNEISGVIAIKEFSEFVNIAEIIIIAVKDEQIVSMVEKLERLKPADKLIFHLSGFHSSKIFGSLSERNIVGCFHPIFPFSEKFINIKNKKIYADVEGGRRFVKRVKFLFRDFKDITLFEINPDDRPLFHLGLTLISNYPLFVIEAGKEIMGSVVCKTLLREISESLLKNSVENYFKFGKISGPLLRGDDDIVKKELNSLNEGELKSIVDGIIKLSKRIKEYKDGNKG